MDFLVSEVPYSHKHYRSLPILLVYFLELDNMILLLMIPWTSDIEHNGR